MTRVVVFLIAVGVLGLGAAWLADRPDDVVVIWQGLRIKTPLWVFVAAILVAIAIIVALWTVLRAFFGSPFMLRRYFDRRRGVGCAWKAGVAMTRVVAFLSLSGCSRSAPPGSSTAPAMWS